jgi:hypothetical protein
VLTGLLSGCHPRSDCPTTIDRQSFATIGALVIAAVIVNSDKLLQGPRAFERAHDGGDYLVTTLVACGAF